MEDRSGDVLAARNGREVVLAAIAVPGLLSAEALILRYPEVCWEWVEVCFLESVRLRHLG